MTKNQLERIIKYNFNDVNLLKEALIHSSFSIKSYKSKKKNYERLEFLGDRVLGLVLAEYIFNIFPCFGGTFQSRISEIEWLSIVYG